MKDFKRDNAQYTPKEALDIVRGTANSIREQIVNSPNIKINDIKLKPLSMPQDNTKVVLPIIKMEPIIDISQVH